MPIYAQRSHAAPVRPEFPETLGLPRPSDDPFFRRGADINITGTLDAIDAALAIHEEVQGFGALESVAIGNTALKSEGQASLVEDLPQEEKIRTAFYRFVGKACVQRVLEGAEQNEEVQSTGPTLAKSITEAKKGNKEAEARVDINVGSALSEAYFKKHFTRTKKQLKDDKIVQFGLATEQMHQDSLVLRPGRPRQLMDFTLAEAMNGLWEQQLARDGELENHWFIAASCVPEDIPEDQLDSRGDGYFTRFMTYSLQGTTQEKDGIITETIFDTGTAADEYASYQDRQDQRFDLAAIGKVYENLGLEAPKTALEMLQKPIRVPKRLMPNGMVDFWRWVGIEADKLRGETKTRTVEDCRAFIDESLEREASLANVRQTVKQELLKLDGTFEKDEDAINALWELARVHGPREATKNKHINPIVFGVRAAHKLIMAKDMITLGDLDGAELLIKSAREEAEISGCGGGSCGLREINPSSSPKVANMMSKLKFESGDRVVQDSERSCIKCGHSGDVVYVYNETGTKVNKGCMSCGAVELGGKE